MISFLGMSIPGFTLHLHGVHCVKENFFWIVLLAFAPGNMFQDVFCNIFLQILRTLSPIFQIQNYSLRYTQNILSVL